MTETAGDPAIVIGLGELLWDCFPDFRRPGGAPANVAYHAGQLGLTGIIASRVGDDPDGAELLAHLAARGLDTGCIQRDALHPTGTVTVDVARADQPRYTIHENVAWDHLELDSAWAGLLPRAAAVCFGTLAQRAPASRATIRRALELAAGALRIYDVNLRPPHYARDWIEDSLRRAAVVKLNDEEAPLLAALLGLGRAGPAPLAAALRERYGVRIVCITRGAAGCLVLAADQTVDVPGRRVQVVDAVGAGDAFTAALTCGLLRGWPLRAAAELANTAGALVATRAGAMPDIRAELAALRAGYAPGGPRSA